MSRRVAVFALLACLPVFAQDKDEEKKLIKELEKKVAEALKQFKKDISSGSEGAKIDGVQKLIAAVNDKQIQEKIGPAAWEKVLPDVTPYLKDTDVVRKKTIEELAKIDHPLVGDALAASVGDCMKSKELATAIVGAVDKCKWDNFYRELTAKLMDKCFDKDLSAVTYQYLAMLEKGGPLSAVDGLIKLLKKLEDNAKNSGGNDQYMQQAKKAIKSCTGEDKATSKDYETWWKANQGTILAKARMVHWCSQTGKRWDCPAADSKAYCPHHGDKKVAGKDKPTIAFVTVK